MFVKPPEMAWFETGDGFNGDWRRIMAFIGRLLLSLWEHHVTFTLLRRWNETNNKKTEARRKKWRRRWRRDSKSDERWRRRKKGSVCAEAEVIAEIARLLFPSVQPSSPTRVYMYKCIDTDVQGVSISAAQSQAIPREKTSRSHGVTFFPFYEASFWRKSNLNFV